ncbi:MAG TPA: phosphoribosylglycinamide formyltransferase [Gammaproteobacteria bacterium]|nr:phosphoribosylglycinamide formyltransferase [Gammaproteobacteria bacterium]
MPAPPAASRLPIVVLVSGHGSNLQAILDKAADLAVQVRAVVSDRPEAQALERARQAGVPVEVVAPKAYPDRAAYDAALTAAVDAYQPGLVVLAGFMRILGPGFVRRFAGRLVNIHPSLLPKYRGLETHRKVLEAGDTQHGCSVHFVTDELDAGAVIAQAEVPVLPGDDEFSLRVRVQGVEHVIYPEVIGWFAAGRLGLKGGQVILDGTPLPGPKTFNWTRLKEPT